MKTDGRLTVLSIQTADNQGGAAAIGWQLGLELERRGVNSRFIVSKKVTNSERVYELPLNPFLKRFPKIYGKDWGEISRFLRTFITANDVEYGADVEIFNHPFYQQADVVQFHNLHGNFFNLSNLIPISQQKKVVWSLHDMWAMMPHGGWSYQKHAKDGFFYRDNLRSYPPMLFDNSAVLRAKKIEIYDKSKLHIVATSEWHARIIQDSVLGSFPMTVIHNGIDASIFRPSHETKIDLRKRLGLPGEKKLVIYLAMRGAKNYQKGWPYLKAAFDTIRHDLNAIVLCVGGEKYSDRAREEGVIYIPYVSDETKVANYLSCADIFVLPSVFENFPFTVLQSMACGTPVVAFDVGGVKEAIQHMETGYLAAYKDMSDLAKGIRFMLTVDDEEISKIVKRASESLHKNFTRKVMADKYLKLYEGLLIRDNS